MTERLIVKELNKHRDKHQTNHSKLMIMTLYNEINSGAQIKKLKAHKI